ncbi:unnamed protein product [Tuber melanosporum]|uniref:(Perigord truffle) hypothetical protein n=1 Tax=Tuber melanosporum (strain Mel28) TaxID=656061 RepID=D5GL53_TUBMM|nr:uncharacterized protein GSTUM_00010010001 [Tuber melanosporum]CAZ85246.1 unnamed protein product [Tuber melanosporum]
MESSGGMWCMISTFLFSFFLFFSSISIFSISSHTLGIEYDAMLFIPCPGLKTNPPPSFSTLVMFLSAQNNL